MLRRTACLLILSVTFAVMADQCHALSAPRALSTSLLARPGVIHIQDRAEPLPGQQESCRQRLSDRLPPPPIVEIRAPARGGTDRRFQPYTMALMQGAAAGRLSSDAAQRTIRLLVGWARADALSQPLDAGAEASNTNALFSLKRALVPIISSYAVLRDHGSWSEADRALVRQWLSRLVPLAEAPTGAGASRWQGRAVSNRNNHRYLTGSVLALWGALEGDPAIFDRAVRIYRDAIADLAPDGSWPLEMARGDKALWYQRQALASLTVIAETAAVQNIDLYGYRPGGVSLHDAVTFLLDRIDETGPGPSLDFLQRRGHGRHYMAWTAFYRKRFPDHANSRRLAALVEDAGVLIDDFVGVNASCWTGLGPEGPVPGSDPS
ncbi:MAG: alginate lyase family protein [Geminicoccaceae bacterium]